MLKANVPFEKSKKKLIMLYFCKKALKYITKKQKEKYLEDYKYIRDKLREYLYSKRKILVIKAKIEEKEINKKIYFLNDQNGHNNEILKGLNDSNTDFYLNYYIYKDKKKFQKYFIPKKKGEYKILLHFKFDINDFSYMFSGCEFLYDINLSYLGKTKVSYIYNLCDGCKRLHYLNLSNLNTENVTDMSCMFRGCKNLYSIDFNSFNTKKVKNMNNAFKDCDSLYDFDLNLIEIELEISKSDLNQKIYFLNNNMNHQNDELKNLNDSIVDLYIDDGKYNFRKYVEPKNVGECSMLLIFKKKMKDCSYMFSGCKNIKKINLNLFKIQDTINAAHMFEDCEKATKLELPRDINTNSVSYMFKGCKELESLYLHNFYTKNATDMSHMFEGCKRIEELDLKSFDTQNVTDTSHMFEGCKRIEELDLKSFDTQNVTDMSHMFEGCKRIKELFKVI